MDAVRSDGARTDRIAVLDSFRALAIIAVVLFHTFYYVNHSPGELKIELGEPWSRIFSYGYLGVEFFFIISGFVIFMTLRTAATFVDFAWRRFSRIYPAYLLCAVLIWCGVRALGYEPYQRSLYDLVVSPVIWTLPLHGSLISGVFWSLVVEVQFYVLIGVVFYTCQDRWFGVGWLLLSVLCIVCQLTSPYLVARLSILGFVPFFTAGICFNRLYHGDFKRIDAICGLVALGTLVYFWRSKPDTLLIIGAMLVLFLLFTLGKLQFLAVKPLVFLGGVSYSWYLLHFELPIALIWWLQRAGVPLILAVPICLSLALLVAVAITRWIERPAKSWLNSIFRRWRPREMAIGTPA
jgi:peptidoglycan/LPS O-acetylase OafA/YrhL